MSTIRLRCTDQVMTVENTPVIASGGLEENSLQVSFCENWTGYRKTAIFWMDRISDAVSVLMDEEGGCVIPAEATKRAGLLKIGVYGANADGVRRTSEVVTYPITQGAYDQENAPDEPTPDVYTQLLSAYSLFDGHMEDVENPHATTADQVGAVPTTRTINGKPMSEDITLTAEDVGALPADWEPDIPTGSGSVSSVNGVSPDETGNVVLTPDDVGVLAVSDGAGAHNSIYRGKDFGSVVTDEQWAAIKDGTFRDLYIGDCWTIGNMVYRIAAFDYYFTCGSDNEEVTDHHVVIVPDAPMYNASMNGSNSTTGGYTGSSLRQSGLESAKATINNAFGSEHILTVHQTLCNAVSGGRPSGTAWFYTTVELMTEQNVFGCTIHGATNNGSSLPSVNIMGKSQFPLFAFRPDLISNRHRYFLRDVATEKYFASVHHAGIAYYDGAGSVFGIRPTFSIKG